MKDPNLKILAAYRMYQAPEGGAENAVRTSYLKDLDVSIGRGGGVGVPPRAHHLHCQGQNMSGQFLSETTETFVFRSRQSMAGRMTVSERAGSCPVVDTLDTTRQSPRHGRRIAEPTSQTATSQLKVGCRLVSHGQGAWNPIAVVDTVTDGASRCKVRTRDDVLDDRLNGRGLIDDDYLEGVTELGGRLNESSDRHNVNSKDGEGE